MIATPLDLSTQQLIVSEDSERALIACVLLAPELFAPVSLKIKAAHFALLRHQYLWRAIERVSQAGAEIDMLTVSQKLKEVGFFDDVGGAPYLAKLMSEPVIVTNAEYYADAVRFQALKRDAWLHAENVRKAVESGVSRDELLAIVQSGANKLNLDASHNGGLVHVAGLVGEHYDMISDIHDGNRQCAGIPPALKALQRLLPTGYEPARVYVNAGRPGMGKSYHLLTEAINAARRGKKVALFTLEMTRNQVLDRAYGMIAKVPVSRIRGGGMTPEDWKHYTAAMKVIDALPMWIDDEGAVTVAHIQAQAALLQATHGLDMICVDYLQIMGADRNYQNRQSEIAANIRALKKLSKTLNVPVLVAAQVGRQAEQRANKRPLLSDLRESGDIETDADVVIGQYCDVEPDDRGAEMTAYELIVLKNRDSGTGTAHVGLFWHTGQFVDVEKRRIDADV